MRRKIKWLILTVLVLFSACQLFLGQEPDTGPYEVLRSLWEDFNNIHANLDFRMSNNSNYNSWYDVYHNNKTGYALKIIPGMSEESLFDVCADMLDELKDPHVGIYAPAYGSRKYSVGRNENFNIAAARSYLKGNGNEGYKNFIFGTFSANPDIGYIYISEFVYEGLEPGGQEWGKAIDNIINSLANTRALVLDIRNNRGGDMNIMEYIAARFVSQPKDYLKIMIKAGPGPGNFSSPVIYTIKSIKNASNNRYGYTKPIVLLTNGNTISAAEWFTLALRTQSHITHIGTTTYGALSPVKNRLMINGWVYSISPGRVTDMNGNFYEGTGISPEEERIIANTPDQPDEQLEEAVKIAAGTE